MSFYKNLEPEHSPGRSLNEAYSLFSDHRSTGNGHHIISRLYPTGDVEVTALQLTHEDSLKNGGGAKRENNDKQSMNTAVLSKSIRRAKTTIRRKCLSMECNRMLTLTFRENVQDIDQAWTKFKYFIKLMHWRYKEFKYVAVPEYQKRGAVHFHLAVRGYYDYNTVRRLWLRAAGQSQGNIDFTKKKSGKELRNPSKIAGYIAKYLNKDESVEFNRKRYSSGGKIELPVPLIGWLSIGDATVYHLCTLLERLTRKSVRTIWESEGRFPIVHIST